MQSHLTSSESSRQQQPVPKNLMYRQIDQIPVVCPLSISQIQFNDFIAFPDGLSIVFKRDEALPAFLDDDEEGEQLYGED